MNKEKFLFNRALHWLKHQNTTGEYPEFTVIPTTGVVFNSNKAADEIELVLTELGNSEGFFVYPLDIVRASLTAVLAMNSNPSGSAYSEIVNKV